MCGIAGIIDLQGRAVDPSVLDRLTDAVSHRGPDGRGTYIRGNVGLGHRRLSILDLSQAAAQPMVSKSGEVAVTFNGEIYNFQELRSELEVKGHRFTSTGDTAVLLALYEEEGEAGFQKLRGMFAFAIFDAKKKKVLLVRDRVGKKPIKYFVKDGILAFASELKALRTLPQCPRGMDEEAISHFLTMMYVPSPGTGFQGIQKLPAAHLLSIDLASGKYEVRRYWQLKYDIDHSRSFESWEKEVESTFEEAVRLRMIADVPVGAFLSGGIDSAAVVATMSKLSSKPIETFTIGTKQETHNELPFASIIAKKFGTNHHPIVVEPNIVELLPKLVSSYEEPYADPSAIPTYLIAEKTREFVTVALNGDGGDENFAGYVRYPILQFSRFWRAMPVHFLASPIVGLFHRMAQSTLSYRMHRFESSIKDSDAKRQLQYLSFFTEEEKWSILKKQFPSTFEWYEKNTADARSRASDPLHQAISADIDTYLADDLLPKVDLGCMASALEARSPFLDHKLLELTARIPGKYKLNGYDKKYFLKRMLKGVIPHEILHKPKTGFRLPLDHWFRHERKEFVRDRLLSSSSPLHGMFKKEGIEKFLQSYYSSSIDYSDHIWALLWLDEWMRQYN